MSHFKVMALPKSEKTTITTIRIKRISTLTEPIAISERVF